MNMIERMESEVRSYCRVFPAVFDRGQDCVLYDAMGKPYLDFFSGAGVLNYGHDNPRFKRKLVEYLEYGGIIHSLDMTTVAKVRLLERFESVILKPRDLDYKVQFPGPTGTNAVESALKLARIVTKRQKILCFTNAFHGMTLGSLSISREASSHEHRGVRLPLSLRLPFDGALGDGTDTIELMDCHLRKCKNPHDLPAAAIVETVQAEGGLNIASFEWLQRLEALCHKYEMLLIVDDIQVGCGRTGPFFSFEPAGIYPDIVCLSKAISGYGLPLALTLIKREVDKWHPGEHTGTFRGHNLAFVTATEALRYWETDLLTREVQRKSQKARLFLETMVAQYPDVLREARGRGLIQGLECRQQGMAKRICLAAFERGLVIETCGAEDQVVKLLPPLIINDTQLETGLHILEEAIADILA